MSIGHLSKGSLNCFIQIKIILNMVHSLSNHAEMLENQSGLHTGQLHTVNPYAMD